MEEREASFERRRVSHHVIGGRESAAREDRRELLRRDDLELRVRAIARRFVRPPAPKLRRVTKACTLHVIVRDLRDELRAKRLPREVLPLAPSALRARHALRIAVLAVAAPRFP